MKEAPERFLSTSVETQMSLAQNNFCAKLAYFGVIYSDSLLPMRRDKVVEKERTVQLNEVIVYNA